MAERERRRSMESRRQFSEYYKPLTKPEAKLIDRPQTSSSSVSKTAMVIFVGILLFSIAVFVSWIDPSKSRVQVTTAAHRPAETYKKAVQQELSRGLNRSFLTLDEEGIGKAIKNRFSEIAVIDVRGSPLSRAVSVKITIEEPAFILKNTQSSFLIDESGFAVVKTRGNNNLITIDDKTGYAIRPGRQVLSTDDMTFLRQLIAGLKANGDAIRSIELPAIARQVRLYLADTPYYVKFHTGGDAKLQLGSLKAVRSQLDASNILPAEYIDVRVEGKVFYR